MPREMSQAGARKKEEAPPAKKLEPFSKLVVVNGYEYDITAFASKHPGGGVILSYDGQDGTAAFREFHSNSLRADAVLSKLPRRPAPPTSSAALAPKDEQVMSEFAAWRQSLKDRGFFRRSSTHVCLRLLELALWAAAACGAMTALGSVPLAVLLLTVFNVRCGWIQHEAGHNSFTTNMKVDKFIQSLAVGMGLSTSGWQWNRMHNKHHATPQKINHDIDLDTLPFFATYKGAVEKSRRRRSVSALWLRMQAFTFVPFTCGLVANFWIYLLHPGNAIRKDRFGLLVMAASHVLKPLAFMHFGGLAPLPAYGLFVLCNWLTAVYLFGHFSLSHTFMPEVEEDVHVTWVRFAMEHTVDISPGNPAIDWIMGYLNYQVIHHLFPSMPQFRGPQVSRELQQKARDWGIEYRTLSYASAWSRMLGNLDDVGAHYFGLMNAKTAASAAA